MNRLAFGFVVLACVSLAMQAVADDYTLGIFGNADMDDTIDEDDIAYVERIIEGTSDETDLADANYDGQIDEDDIIQIEQIINGEEKELTIVQYLGYGPEFTEEPVTVPMPIKTIIDTSYNSVIMLCAFGVQDRIVGIVESAKTVKEIGTFLEDKTVVGNSNHEWDIEKILETNPDIVHSAGNYPPEYEEQLGSGTHTIPIVMMDFSTPEKFTREVKNMGYLLDKKDRAEELINFEEHYSCLIQDKVKDLSDEQKPRVYLESYKDYKACGPGYPYHQPIVDCGGINIFNDITSAVDIDPEAVIVRNPQVIVKLIYSGYVPSGYGVTDTSSLEKVRSDIMSRPGWDDIDAVKNGRVYLIDLDAKSVHPSVYQSYLAKWLHPDLFEDMDPVAIHKEWIEQFLGIEYEGVYAYPAYPV